MERKRKCGASGLFREKAVFLVYFKRAKVRQGVEEKVLLSNEVRAVGAETVVLDAHRAQARQTHQRRKDALQAWKSGLRQYLRFSTSSCASICTCVLANLAHPGRCC